jgi:hypothetical protein
MVSQVVFADEHLEGIENAKNSSLIHVLHILWDNGRISQFTANDGEPVSDFLGLPCRSSRFQSIARNRRAFNCRWRK